MGDNQMRRVSFIFKKKFYIVFSILLLIGSIIHQTPVSVANAATSTSGWNSAYNKILNNWKTIDKYGDVSYLKFYFGSDYKFDKYFLCDVDGNETPELFLYSSTMGLTAVLTYSNKKIVFLTYNNISKINIKNSQIIIQGHWHGAGGSGENEWSIYKIKKASYVMKYYIDNLGGQYSVYDTNWKKVSSKKAFYSKILSKYVKSENCTDYKEFKKYNLNNKKGLDHYYGEKSDEDVKSIS